MTERIYTQDELLRERPRGEVLVRGLRLGEDVSRAFVCHGCQSCGDLDPVTDELRWYYPHFLSIAPVPE
jgi:hypothetical protein